MSNEMKLFYYAGWLSFMTVLFTSAVVSTIRVCNAPVVSAAGLMLDYHLWPSVVLMLLLIPKAIAFSFEGVKKSDIATYHHQAKRYHASDELGCSAWFAMISWTITVALIGFSMGIHWALEEHISRVFLYLTTFAIHFVAYHGGYAMIENPCAEFAAVQNKK